MLRARLIFASVVAGSCTLAAFAGCGGKNKSEADYEPPPVVVANAAPPVESKVEPKPTTPDPKAPFQIDPVPPKPELPNVPPPTLPMPKEPPAKDPPMPFVPPPMPDRPMVEKKDPDKPFEWPTSLYARAMSEWIKDIDDNDPAIREQGLRTVPGFGPPARKAATKRVLFRMNGVNESDPGVRAAAFEAIGVFVQFGPEGGLESETDTTEAIRILMLSLQAGGATRLHAVNTLASFGPRAAGAIPSLIGLDMTKTEKAYETRRAVASTLGSISYIKNSGPSSRALHSLSDVLVHDPSAAVRLAAYQSIVALGPPQLPPAQMPPGALGKPKMVVNQNAVDDYVKSIKTRLLPYKAPVGGKERESPTGLMERDRQVEIFARFALMRLDVKEINDENLTGIAKYIVAPGDSGPKLQALNALSFMGDLSSRKISDVLRALEDGDPQVVTTAVTTLVSMGQAGKPAIEFLEKLKTRGSKKEDKEAKDLPREYYADLATRAIKAIKEAKPSVARP